MGDKRLKKLSEVRASVNADVVRRADEEFAEEYVASALSHIRQRSRDDREASQGAGADRSQGQGDRIKTVSEAIVVCQQFGLEISALSDDLFPVAEALQKAQDPYLQAIKFAVEVARDEAATFLNLWRDGDLDGLRIEFPAFFNSEQE